ncbi:hypothetical protein EVAR_44210_1 [Eumeta japonica]|uniref:Uncharacterized protein n=1 Tax=Eumeta variegata TaxID=151549 RepID=A0A4C1W2A3_EUMVA|nr:hypothetical protein EVAR_44210_1 [Eumeta japonica]
MTSMPGVCPRLGLLLQDSCRLLEQKSPCANRTKQHMAKDCCCPVFRREARRRKLEFLPVCLQSQPISSRRIAAASAAAFFTLHLPIEPPNGPLSPTV